MRRSHGILPRVPQAAVSGFCALGYEVLYLLRLTSLLGDMLYVHAPLLSSFLVGVGIGALVAHRLHRWIFAEEAGTGLYALSLPVITGWMGHQAWMAEVAGSPGDRSRAVGGILDAALQRLRQGRAARSFGPRILGAVFAASLARAVFQMLFLKVTYLVFTPHRENFALAVGGSLPGIAMGSWWVARTSPRFQSAMVLVPLALGAAFLAHPLLADLFVAMYAQTGASGWGGRVGRAHHPDWIRSGLRLRPHDGIRCRSAGPHAIGGVRGRGVGTSPVRLQRGQRRGLRLVVFAIHPAFTRSVTLVLIGACAAAAAALVSGEPFTRMERAIAVAGVALATALLGTWDDADFYLARQRAVLVDGVDQINRAFLYLARMLRHPTFGLDMNPRARIEITDGRSYLVGKEGVYDAIVNSIPAPTYLLRIEDLHGGVPPARPGGAQAGWRLRHVAVGISTVLRTLAEVFPHRGLRPLRSNYYMATGGGKPPMSRSAELLGLSPKALRLFGESLGGFDPVRVPR